VVLAIHTIGARSKSGARRRGPLAIFERLTRRRARPNDGRCSRSGSTAGCDCDASEGWAAIDTGLMIGKVSERCFALLSHPPPNGRSIPLELDHLVQPLSFGPKPRNALDRSRPNRASTAPMSRRSKTMPTPFSMGG
jgi:hypothetical protein